MHMSLEMQRTGSGSLGNPPVTVTDSEDSEVTQLTRCDRPRVHAMSHVGHMRIEGAARSAHAVNTSRDIAGYMRHVPRRIRQAQDSRSHVVGIALGRVSMAWKPCGRDRLPSRRAGPLRWTNNRVELRDGDVAYLPALELFPRDTQHAGLAEAGGAAKPMSQCAHGGRIDRIGTREHPDLRSDDGPRLAISDCYERQVERPREIERAGAITPDPAEVRTIRKRNVGDNIKVADTVPHPPKMDDVRCQSAFVQIQQLIELRQPLDGELALAGQCCAEVAGLPISHMTSVSGNDS